jgi:TctA family transporter
MLQIILGILLIFLYPFLSLRASFIAITIAIILTIIPFFLIDVESFGSYLITNSMLFIVGATIRYFVQKSKYNSEIDDLIDQYKEKP